MRDFLLLKITDSALRKFQRLLAMHYCVTVTAFESVKDRNLKATINVLGPSDGLLSDHKKLAGALHDKCYFHIKPNCENQRCLKVL